MITLKNKLCVIIGAGDEGDVGALGKLLEPGAFVICADGGFHLCEKMGLSPGLLIGDFDSVKNKASDLSEDLEFANKTEKIILSADKNYTDSFYAAQEGFNRGFRRFLLFGMLGGRLDHTMANLGLLSWLKAQGADALLTDGRTEARALTGPGSLTIPNRPGCYFSLLPLSNCESVSITGGKYPLKDYPLTAADQRAISNEFTGSDVTVTQKSGMLIVVSISK